LWQSSTLKQEPQKFLQRRLDPNNGKFAHRQGEPIWKWPHNTGGGEHNLVWQQSSPTFAFYKHTNSRMKNTKGSAKYQQVTLLQRRWTQTIIGSVKAEKILRSLMIIEEI
jgi:hypothetical protein